MNSAALNRPYYMLFDKMNLKRLELYAGLATTCIRPKYDRSTLFILEIKVQIPDIEEGFEE
jgi:hypothetical protein